MDYVWFCVFKGLYCFVFLRDHTVYGLCLVLCFKRTLLYCVFKGSYCIWTMFGFVFLRDHTVYGLFDFVF